MFDALARVISASIVNNYDFVSTFRQVVLNPFGYDHLFILHNSHDSQLPIVGFKTGAMS